MRREQIVLNKEQSEQYRDGHRNRFTLVIVLVMCCFFCASKQRDTSTHEKSLLGHWVWKSDELGDVHFFFSEHELITIGKMNERSPVETRHMRYSILSKGDDYLNIYVSPVGSSMGHQKYLKFSYDRKSLVEIPRLLGFDHSPRDWVYVNTKQKP